MELMFRRGDRYSWAVGNSAVTSMPLLRSEVIGQYGNVCYRLGFQLQTWALILSKISRTLILHGKSFS